jgi:hypothetical protein
LRLRLCLPEYMVPALLVEVPGLPLTANGKLDRQQLLQYEHVSYSNPERNYVPAQNSTEEVLCAIWSEMLGVERVGIEDNFFELGGDSILSIQVVSRPGTRACI